jgi:hypothetical protein
LTFNGYLIIYGVSKAITEGKPVSGVTAAGIVVTVVYLIVMVVICYRSFFRGVADEMNPTLDYTRKNLFKPRISSVLWLTSLIACFIYLAIKKATQVNPMLMEGYFLLVFIIIGAGNVFINKLRALLNLISLAFIYGCILLINNASESGWIGMVIVMLLFLQLFANFAIMHFERNNLRVD